MNRIMKPANYPSLKGKTVYVTGGAGGIGEAVSSAFADQGAKVGIIDLDGDAGANLVSKLGAGAFAVQCDLRDIEALKAAFVKLKAEIGPADILVNNAAHDQRHSWRDMTAEYWDERMAVNLRHMFFAIQAVAPDMIANNFGSIINFSSTSWKLKMGTLPAYTTAKAAVHGLTRSFMMEFGKHNIRVNTVFPGWTMTKRQKELWFDDAGQKVLDEHQAMRGLIQPEDVANMVLFLAADDSRFCTGQEFIVDGGWA
ncbi:MAG: SDR family NAD(P)-dependent oxidoreductase [Rhizobiaceae bacterium]